MTIISFPDLKTACGYGKTPEWVILPVAPLAVARSRFCGDEKLPQAVPLYGALTWMDDLRERGILIGGLDLNGPGDPLASQSLTLELVSQLHSKYPELDLGLTTLGLGLADIASQLAKCGVGRVTLLVDAVSREVVEKMYAWIRPGKRNMQLAESAVILIDEQARGIPACRSAGISVAVLTTVYSNVNEKEVESIARVVSALGAESMTLLPGAGWSEEGEKLPLPDPERMIQLSEASASYIRIVKDPTQKSPGETTAPASCGTRVPEPTASRPNAAVLSSNGMDVDLHLGQAIKALIYGPREDGLTCLLEARDMPEPGGGENRWQKVAEVLSDCFVLLAESAGHKPHEILGRTGLTIVLINDNVESSVDVLFGGGKKGKRFQR